MEMADTVGPGMDMSFHVSQTEIVRLPEPYGTCRQQINLTDIDLKQRDWVYTFNACTGFGAQQQFIDSCQGLIGFLPFTDAQEKQGRHINCCNRSYPEVFNQVKIQLDVARRTLSMKDL